MKTHSETPARLLRIRGLVQGVGYRNALHREATRLGIKGWVRNRSDGSVETLVAGPRPAGRLGSPWSARGAGRRAELGGRRGACRGRFPPRSDALAPAAGG